MKNFSMGKVLYTLVVVLITAWSVFFISNYYHNKAGNQVNTFHHKSHKIFLICTDSEDRHRNTMRNTQCGFFSAFASSHKLGDKYKISFHP